jgi:hypothetical protein
MTLLALARRVLFYEALRVPLPFDLLANSALTALLCTRVFYVLAVLGKLRGSDHLRPSNQERTTEFFRLDLRNFDRCRIAVPALSEPFML